MDEVYATVGRLSTVFTTTEQRLGITIPYPQRQVSGRAESGGFSITVDRDEASQRAGDEPARDVPPMGDGGRSSGDERDTASVDRIERDGVDVNLAARRGLETEVYQPAEDSHLLAAGAVDGIDEDHLVLDVGTGSGYVAAFVSSETGATVVGADVNPHACEAARKRGMDAVRADLVDPFRHSTFDVVLFNPPYLPTGPEDEREDWMEVALSGGTSGRRVIDPFLDSVGRVLTPDGVVYLLVSSLTGVEEVVARAGDRGFNASAVCDESFPFETLTVLRLF